MLIKVCLLLLTVGVYASYADSSSESTTDDEFFEVLESVFPSNFLSKYPAEGEFFRLKIFVYLFFNGFAKYFAENEPLQFWLKFNRNDFTRVAIDAIFYEYLTKFADRENKNLVYDPLGSSKRSHEDIAIHRIGDYLDNLSAAEAPVDESETRLQTKRKGFGHHDAKCATVPVKTPTFGIPGKDFPNYCDIPETSFICENKLVPGIYADVETGCQVFHACWSRRVDSFLCPIGTTFNQDLLTCDFWHESDCSSAPLFFDQPLFAKPKTPRNTEPTVIMSDETETTSESFIVFSDELDPPEYDGTCQSLISKPLQLSMKFLPEKCKVTDLDQSKPDTSTESNEYNDKRFGQLMADILSRNFRNMLVFLKKAARQGNGEIARMMGATQRLGSETEKPHQTSDSIFEKADVEFASKRGYIDTSEDQMYYSTTELPSDELPTQATSEFVENIVFEVVSQEKEKHDHHIKKSTPLKPSKMSEESKRHALDTMVRTLELGGNVLTDGVLPMMERIVLNSPKKMYKSEKCSSATDVE